MIRMKRSVLFALSLLGIFDAAYLSWVYTSSSPIVCGGTGCDVVRATQYAHWAGVPTPVYGLAMYGVMALLFFAWPLFGPAKAKLAGYAATALAGAGFLFSAYLTSLEAFVIHAWCTWCVISALTVTAILAILISDLARLRNPMPSAEGDALRQTQRNFGILVFAVVAGVPGFWLLMLRGESPPVKPPTAQTLGSHLVRPNTHFYGNPDAAVTVVEFGDFECPVCGEAEPAVRKAREHFAGDVRFAFRQFPLRLIHPDAEKAAEASECAAAQGAFWQAVNVLYEHQSDLAVPALERYAGEMGLNQPQFNQCLTSGDMAARVERDKADGRALGVHATPTFFINGKMVQGALTYAQLSDLIDRQLAAASAKRAEVPKPPAPSGPQGSDSSTMTVQIPSSPSPFGTSGGAGALGALGASPLACSDAEAKMRQPALIHTAEALKLFKETPPPLFVDVRTRAAFAKDHISGAVNIPIGDFEKDSGRLPKNRIIVLYQGGRSSGDICASSRAAGRILLAREYPFHQIKVYKEGLAAWMKAGLPVNR